jgi:hypothetical protein
MKGFFEKSGYPFILHFLSILYGIRKNQKSAACRHRQTTAQSFDSGALWFGQACGGEPDRH